MAIALLLIRMVPDSFSRPFILARIQRELPDDIRATYLSLQSLVGRLLFAGSLFLASGSASDVGAMPQGQVQAILGAYATIGCLCFVGLLIVARRQRL